MPVAGALAVTVWAQHNITINSACQLVVSMARRDLDRRRGMTVPRSRRHNAEERRCPVHADSTQRNDGAPSTQIIGFIHFIPFHGTYGLESSNRSTNSRLVRIEAVFWADPSLLLS